MSSIAGFPRLLDRHVLREVALASLLATAAFMFVLVAANIMQQVLGSLSLGRIDGWQALELVALLFPSLLPYALPLGLLTGVLITLGRMGAEGEITAMKSIGVSVPRIALPVWVLAGVLALLCVWLQLEVGPASEDAFQLVLIGSARLTPASLITPGKLNRQFRGLLIRAGARDGEVLHDFRLWQIDERGRITQSLKAREARLSRVQDVAGRALLRVELTEAELMDSAGKVETASVNFSQAKTATLNFPAEQLPNEPGTYIKRLRMMTAGDLLEARRTGSRLAPGATATEREANRTQLLVQLMFRLTTAVSVFSLAFLAVPLAIMVGRSETNANAGLALGVALVFYVLTSAASWVKAPAAHPELLIWIPNLLLLALGWWLLKRVARH